jgi:hypothetical protein
VSFSRNRFKSLLCLVSLSLIFCSAVYPSFPEVIQKESSELLKYEIDSVYAGSLKQAITIVNRSPIPVSGELFVPLIKNETARHYVILHSISSSQTLHETFLNDNSGNRYLHWSNLKIDEEQTFTLELDYYVLSFSIHYLIDLGIVENYDTSSETYKKYVEAEELIESSNSRIISLAYNLTNDVDSWHEKAVRIYDFVYRHMHYEEQDEERGALWALENGAGDCSEYSYLFIALCRAAGIPARIQAGFAFHHSSETLENGHMWAEYYLENYGWMPVDVTWRLFDSIDDKHFSSIQSVPERIPYANYFFHSEAEENNVEDEQLVSLTPCTTDVFGDNFIENVVNTIEKTSQAEFAIFLGKIFGITLIFPSEVEEVEQTFLESQIQLQNAIDFWNQNSKIAESNAANALKNVEETLQNAWMLIVKAFTIFIGITIVILLIGLFFLKRYQTKQDRNSEQKFHLHDALILNWRRKQL